MEMPMCERANEVRAGGWASDWSSERIFGICMVNMCAHLGVHWQFMWHVLSSEQIDMDGENKLENKINIVYYVHGAWALKTG